MLIFLPNLLLLTINIAFLKTQFQSIFDIMNSLMRINDHLFIILKTSLKSAITEPEQSIMSGDIIMLQIYS